MLIKAVVFNLLYTDEWMCTRKRCTQTDEMWGTGSNKAKKKNNIEDIKTKQPIIYIKT